MAEDMVQNVAYRATVCRTGLPFKGLGFNLDILLTVSPKEYPKYIGHFLLEFLMTNIFRVLLGFTHQKSSKAGSK